MLRSSTRGSRPIARSLARLIVATLASTAPLSAWGQSEATPAPPADPAPQVDPREPPAPPPAREPPDPPQPPDAPADPSDEPEPVDLESYQGLELEELLATPVAVWSASKTVTAIADAPAVVTVLLGEDLRRWGYRSIAEVLQRMVGFYVVDDHVLPNVAVRGVSGGLNSESGLVKVMIDGQPTSFRSTAGNWLGPEFLPLSAIDRVEIVRGPSSALYGADAFLGVVNVVTRSPGRLGGADLSATAARPGSSGTWGGGADLSIGTRRGAFELLLAFRSDERDYSGLLLPASSPAPVIPTQKFDNRVTSGMTLASAVGYGKATYHFSRETRLTLSGSLSTIDRVAEFSPTTQLSHGLDGDGRNNETRVALQQASVGLKLDSAFHPDLHLTVDLTYHQGGPRARDRIEVGSNLFWVRRKFGYHATDSTLQLSWRIMPRLSVLGGLGFIFDRETLPTSERVLKGQSGAHEPGDAIANQPAPHRNLINPGAYVQVMWEPLERWLNLTGGLRIDRHNIYGNQLSARAVAVSELVPDTFAKLLYGLSFKAPSPFLLYANPSYVGGIIGNPDLKPQYIHTVEGQLTYQRRVLTLSTGVVYNLLRDKAEFTQQDLNKVARNFSGSRSLSWETSLELRYLDRVAGYLRNEVARVRRDPGQEGYVANLVGKDNVIYPALITRAGVMAQLPWLPLRATVEALYAGKRRASDTNILEKGASYQLPAYLLLGGSIATAGLRFFKLHETTLMVSAHNLLRAKGPDPGFAGVDYPLAPRTVLFELRQRL